MFRKTLALVSIGAVLLATSIAQQPSPQTNSVLIREGQGLKFATLAPLSSATARPGGDVPLRLRTPLTWGSLTLIPEGQVVYATVSKVKHAKPGCTDGNIRLKLKQLTFADGTRVAAEVVFTDPDPGYRVAAQQPSGHVSVGLWAMLVPFDAVFGAIAGPYVLGHVWVHRCRGLGNDYILPAGSTVAVRIAKDYRIRYCTSKTPGGADLKPSFCP